MLVFSYIYSLFFCLRYLPFREAIKIPIMVHPDGLKVGKMRRGQIVFSSPVHRAMVVMGFTGSEGRDTRKSLLTIHEGGKLTLGSGVTFTRGTQMVINGGEVKIGNGFFCNADCFFTCNDSITIGEHCLFGWNIDLNTTDGHKVNIDGEWRNPTGAISMGDHVWVCSDSHISKNVTIANGCVVAQRSLVNKSCLTPNTLIGGMPAREIRHNINWKG